MVRDCISESGRIVLQIYVLIEWDLEHIFTSLQNIIYSTPSSTSSL